MRNHHDARSYRCRGAKDASGNVRNTDDARSGNGNHRDITCCGDGLHAIGCGADGLRDLGPRLLRLKTVANPHWDPVLRSPGVESSDAALSRRRMRVRPPRYRKPHPSVTASGTIRVRSQHSVHIGPDDDFVCIQGRAQNGCGEIRSTAPERRWNTLGRRAT